MSSRSDNHRYCSVNAMWHRFRGGRCEAEDVMCPSCNVWNEVKPEGEMKCRNCSKVIPLTEEDNEALTHPEENFIICPADQHRLRLQPRDKRRHLGLKKE